MAGPIEKTLLASLDARFSVRWFSALGSRLRYLEGGNGPPLVLLHGRGHAATMWYPVLPRLSNRFRVLAIDLPGFGSSGPGHLDGTRPEQGLAFFVKPVEELLVSLRLEAPTLVGHSLGAFVALELAHRRAFEVSKLVGLAAMGIGPELSLGSRAVFLLTNEWVARTLGRRALKVLGALPDEALLNQVAALEHELMSVEEGRPLAAHAFNALFPAVGPAFFRPEYAQLPHPKLFVWGEKDPVLPVRMARRVVARFANARLEVLEGVGHAPQLEAHEKVAELVERFASPEARS